jgi:hypothetical protein
MASRIGDDQSLDVLLLMDGAPMPLPSSMPQDNSLDGWLMECVARLVAIAARVHRIGGMQRPRAAERRHAGHIGDTLFRLTPATFKPILRLIRRRA